MKNNICILIAVGVTFTALLGVFFYCLFFGGPEIEESDAWETKNNGQTTTAEQTTVKSNDEGKSGTDTDNTDSTQFDGCQHVEPKIMYEVTVLKESYEEQGEFERDAREGWSQLAAKGFEAAQKEILDDYNWQHTAHQYNLRVAEVAQKCQLTNLPEAELLMETFDDMMFRLDKLEYDRFCSSLSYQKIKMLLDGRMQVKHDETVELAKKSCHREYYADALSVSAATFEQRACFYIECYEEIERLASQEWKERFNKNDTEYYRKWSGEKLWEDGVRNTEEIPSAMKEYLDPLIYKPGTKDVYDIRYEYKNISFNLLENWRFVLRHEALGESPVFGKFWFDEKGLHLRSDDRKYHLVLKDAGGSYTFLAEASGGLRGEASIPDGALFEGIHRMERYPLEWLE